MFLELAKERFSCRNYKSDLIPDELLLKVFEAFRVAPSAVNFQPWHILIYKEQENKEKIFQAYPREWIKTAPVLLVICADHSKSWKRKDGKDHADIDISIAVDHLTLQAAELGLATCWVCNFDRDRLEKAIQLPDHMEAIVIIPIGYPNDKGDLERHLKRKSINEFTHWEKS
jgi:nitroreductase